MKIISEEKEDIVKSRISNEHAVIGFEIGVCFAEEELSNLAIEFAKFCNGNFYVIDEDVFTKFLEQRNK